MTKQHQPGTTFIAFEGNAESLQLVIDKVRRGEHLIPSLPELADGDALLLLDEQGTPAIRFKAPMKAKAFVHAPVIHIHLEHYQYPIEGHTVRIRVIVYDDVAHPYGFELFMDPSQPQSQTILEALARCTSIRLHLQPMRRKPSDPLVVTRVLPWAEEQCRNARQICELTVGCRTLWPAVIDRCAREVPLFDKPA